MANELKTSIVIELINKMTSPLKAATKDFEAFRKSAELANKAFAMGANLKQTAQAVKGVSDKLQEMFKVPVESASSFQKTLAQIQVRSGATAEDVKKIADAANEMGMTDEFNSQKFAAATAIIMESGKTATEAIKQVKDASVLASAHEIDLAQATYATSQALKSYNLSANQAAYVQDVFTSAVKNGAGNINDVMSTIVDSGAKLSNFGVDIKQTATLMAVLGKAGVKKDAAIALETISMSLAGAGRRGETAAKGLAYFKVQTKDINGAMRPMTDILKDLNVALEGNKDKARYLNAMFGPEGVSAFMSIFKNGPQVIDSVSASMNKLKGSTQAASDIMEATEDQAKTKLLAALSTLAVKIGTDLLPHITKLEQILRKIILGIANWTKNNPGLTKALLGLGVATAVLTAALSGVLMVIASLAGAAGFAALIFGVNMTGIAMLRTAATGIKSFIVSLARLLYQIGLVAVALTVQLIGALMKAALWGTIAAAPFLAVAAAIGAVTLAVIELKKYWDMLDFGEVWKGIKMAVGEKGLWETFKEATDVTPLMSDVQKLVTPGMSKQSVNVGGNINIALAKGLQQTSASTYGGIDFTTLSNTGPAMEPSR
jgi:TP901 family phage tail tape measure protein